MSGVDSRPRRSVLRAAVLATVAILLPPPPSAQALAEKRLAFYHTHTGERLDVVYKRGDTYVAEGLDAINALLLDFRTGERPQIDPKLLDLVYDLRERLGGEGTFEVISAYRSPKTNEMLRSASPKVAKKSMHLLGRAIDLRLTGVELKRLRDSAIAMQRGGVGYYPRTNFVHVDTGRVRRW